MSFLEMNDPVIFAIIAFGIKIDGTLVVHAVGHFLLALAVYAFASWLLSKAGQKLSWMWLRNDSTAKWIAFGVSFVANLATEITQGLQYQFDSNNFFGIDDFPVGIVAALLACKYAQIIVNWLNGIISERWRHG